MSEYDPDLVEKAARAYRAAWHAADAEPGDKPEGYRSEAGIRAVLDAVADPLRAEGNTVAKKAVDALVRRAKAEGARQVRDAVEQAAPRLNSELRHDGSEDPQMAAYIEGHRDAWAAAREAVASIEKGGE